MCHDVVSRPICHVAEDRRTARRGRKEVLSKGFGTMLAHQEKRRAVQVIVLTVLYCSSESTTFTDSRSRTGPVTIRTSFAP